MRSVLGHMLPEAMVCYLENYEPEKFAEIFLGEFDTPEAIWNREMRLTFRVVTCYRPKCKLLVTLHPESWCPPLKLHHSLFLMSQKVGGNDVCSSMILWPSPCGNQLPRWASETASAKFQSVL